ncbi:MAG: hypothetical protein WCR67_05190 [Bacilli bacterium]
MKTKSLLLASLAAVMLVSCGPVGVSSSGVSSSGESSVPPVSTSKAPEVAISAITGEKTMLYGRSQTVTATVTNATDTGIAWSVTQSTDKKDILKVTDAGVVTAIDVGTAKVVATAKADATKKAELEITVEVPGIADSVFAIENNYTLSIQYSQTDFLNVKMNEKGALINNSGYWYADSKVYPVHFSEDMKTSWYFTDEFLKDSKNNTIPDTTFKNMYNVKLWLGNTTWEYLDYDAETKTDFYGSAKDETEKIDYSLFCFSLYFKISSYTDGYSQLNVADNKMVSLNFVTGTGKDDGIGLSNTYTNVGTTDIGFTPTRKTIHEGGEAGDGDGAGEDF